MKQAPCPACGAVPQPQDTICSLCGYPFAGQPAATIGVPLQPSATSQPAPVAPACPHCGQPVQTNTPVCGQCGQSLLLTYRPLKSGQVLAQGAFTVQRALSRGGMGAIYLATDHNAFDRAVVIKAMLDYFDPTNPHAVQAANQRFVQEARTLATLRHPAIPQIYTYFQDGPYNYIVMEYIEGRDLQQGLTYRDKTTGHLIPGRAYPSTDVIRWGITLCRVLEYLASRSPHAVVHHDIKPANIILDSNSHDIRLVDFGTAKARLLVQAGGSVGVHQSSIYGTQGYAPPEQYQGKSEPRSDVYALAVTLYHLATDDDPGDHPFNFPNLGQLGTLGQALHHALLLDVHQRPTATQLRHQLEALTTPTHTIQTVDGTGLTSEQELADWCMQNWELATSWLYDQNQLAEQIARMWGKNKLAHDIRALTTHYADNPDAGLNAVLRLLNPHIPVPQVAINKTVLDFGELVPGIPVTQQVEVSANGHGYIEAPIRTDDAWLSVTPATVNLRGGGTTLIAITAQAVPPQGSRILTGMIIVDPQHSPALSIPASASTICRAPDGTRLTDSAALVKWCEQHWHQAALWLRSNEPHSLPNQVRIALGRPDLAQQLGGLTSTYQGDQFSRLDKALALLDPQGFGNEAFHLACHPKTLHFGSLGIRARGDKGQTVQLTNVGRRYMYKAKLHSPDWIVVRESYLTLLPGEQRAIDVDPDTSQVKRLGRLSGQVMVSSDSTVVNAVKVQAWVSLWLTFWHSSIGQLLNRFVYGILIWFLGSVGAIAGLAFALNSGEMVLLPGFVRVIILNGAEMVLPSGLVSTRFVYCTSLSAVGGALGLALGTLLLRETPPPVSKEDEEDPFRYGTALLALLLFGASILVPVWLYASSPRPSFETDIAIEGNSICFGLIISLAMLSWVLHADRSNYVVGSGMLGGVYAGMMSGIMTYMVYIEPDYKTALISMAAVFGSYIGTFIGWLVGWMVAIAGTVFHLSSNA